jgi:Ala-tRNA(Pro) deacylase
MPAYADRAALLSHLDALGVWRETRDHAPIFTVDEGEGLKRNIPGGHSKNLFLKDKKGGLWLICALGETKIDLNAAAKAMGAPRFSFGSAELLEEALGVTPGSVTLFALLNDPQAHVHLVLDAALLGCEIVNFHPLTNTATTSIDQNGLRAFVASVRRTPLVLDFSTLTLVPWD